MDGCNAFIIFLDYPKSQKHFIAFNVYFVNVT